ncbi:hypothetical protein JR316_0011396 [Psilocybe cubensis]|uniref:Uncharacterized protein n=1 Tax=Psilocybe cubensis TaxID=181762 RepID=A0ACB8GJH3_PSICU|nr:hypothetical protein JR316_0011396 [Psilocybe cubensis]KAH9475836.1 hypothetical protein JR316_0011396 [Psilocybe cubensis]
MNTAGPDVPPFDASNRYLSSYTGPLATIYSTAPVGNCEMLSKVPPAVFLVALPSTSLLFYFRVSALYSNKYVSAVFFVMWLSILGGCIPIIRSVSGAHIGPTNYCISIALEDAAAPGTIIPLIYDSTIFIAISWRLMRMSLPHDTGLKEAVKVVAFGKNLSKFSKSLLQDGQAYYL